MCHKKQACTGHGASFLSRTSGGAPENLQRTKGSAPENFQRTGGSVPENFQCTALLALFQIQQCNGITNHTINYGRVLRGWCADQTIHPRVYSLRSAPPS